MKTKLHSSLFRVVVSILAIVGSMSHAAERYVSNSGSDSAAGTLAAPWKTIQKAASTAKAGDTVYVREGVYPEKVQVNVTGTATAPIVFRNYEGETPVMDMSSLTPGADLTAAIRITGKNFITIQGFEICNYKTNDDTCVPAGILISGSCKGVMIKANKIHHIEQNNDGEYNYDANAHGIAVYGNAATAVDGLAICANEVCNLKLGASEAIVLNGNVTNFQVCNNQVHHVNNIGIDAIGMEGTCPTPSLDKARNGLIAGNKVWAVDSSTNPAYGGNFTTGGGARAAAGIYVDGGTQIMIERNEVWSSNFGVELASEAEGGVTNYITLRNNILRHNDGAGIMMGGYDENRGSTENCTIVNNTLYMNDTMDTWAGQIQFQFYVNNNTFKNNILWANPDTKQMVVHYPGSDSASDEQKEFGAGNVFAYNLYYVVGGSVADAGFEMFTGGAMKHYDGIVAWQRSNKVGGDSGSSFANPKFVGGAPSIMATASQFQLSRTSPAINSGAPSAQYAVANTQKDFFGGVRLKNARLDRGADEF